MKLISHNAKRKGDIATVNAKWISRTRQGASVSLALHKGEDGRDVDVAIADKPLIQADIKDVQGVMFGIAQIAWSWGWRPAGFEAALMQVVRDYGKGSRP